MCQKIKITLLMQWIFINTTSLPMSKSASPFIEMLNLDLVSVKYIFWICFSMIIGFLAAPFRLMKMTLTTVVRRKAEENLVYLYVYMSWTCSIYWILEFECRNKCLLPSSCSYFFYYVLTLSSVLWSHVAYLTLCIST